MEFDTFPRSVVTHTAVKSPELSR